MNKSNIFDLIPATLKDELFEELISKESLKIERIISRGHTTPEHEWYDQRSNEWVILLQGEAILSFLNENDVRLKAGDYINIPAHKKHKVSWTKPDEDTVWLAVHY
ncbi:MAG: cupin [Sulfurimonas sp. RIFCSPHIGHO2_12_FULL_36_9]|uniref:cupin domain-containing protein n=1 Tax=Sulfurimonas sp. RIFCSPLOWO2_12_36_12 TaxID=1802253 RepID=UPI0008C2B489|nr:cupin domain-containing protein [Sulfurimonas sp. RIFCSPLOWO2_12_36_12]OHD97333.1 MAG: cupin [Sulfurimonas sp. RIFCSPHIGHO2_12_FULL_36_9]OHD98660.1 MAG: cupin [Sulfurimonas sp. RIFCSPLOWO2_02_FULL_36_28]OHE02790.1 MAG: cupin [Sulfurimonas sp. RIFCSPLOWO2_12_36_12]OHE06774.1 MAG: cupin [Sulfurimonas sp. RIFCSPLOWO2_12_FULL_36_74]